MREATGLFIIEVFPAFALASINPAFFGRLSAPHYNPKRRRTFTKESWKLVGKTARIYALQFGMELVAHWCSELMANDNPRKCDQDKLSAIICMLVALIWRLKPRQHSVMIGDLKNGYMIAPVSVAARARLKISAAQRGVPLI